MSRWLCFAVVAMSVAVCYADTLVLWADNAAADADSAVSSQPEDPNASPTDDSPYTVRIDDGRDLDAEATTFGDQSASDAGRSAYRINEADAIVFTGAQVVQWDATHCTWDAPTSVAGNLTRWQAAFVTPQRPWSHGVGFDVPAHNFGGSGVNLLYTLPSGADGRTATPAAGTGVAALTY